MWPHLGGGHHILWAAVESQVLPPLEAGVMGASSPELHSERGWG